MCRTKLGLLTGKKAVDAVVMVEGPVGVVQQGLAVAAIL